ncbi:SDR family NAD(P)-dependent oxidoreductase [Phaeovulum vinaykumarii]|uniref:NAD(P)-dependent dehydrogenase, short-chain alcohol dehydrogenase family n=1 Tax=Phaeovulum vinaykumarii TaxID=407234 RepID=A0A1N7L2G8_9RHOB|nr:SDR family NAD(P)-dependent oxidoreductase [Phaeovulum vinaykumarii]SIS68014.1 NAD(P)-dependent dehydrogenase, short-chain alcohol dehydrogenase family [Phaeovulum vinaykumarii]SOC00406.1 NAD(P)-dependent dehydrogenase (short-subunit alcohol dehydrogenase family) [Phaeovulum vinaykumarii]
MDIQGLAAIVTGGASGLGAATAGLLAAEGAKVAILDYNAAAAEEMAARIGGVGIGCDVSDGASVAEAFARATAAHGPARILVNCAGVAPAQKILGRSGVMPLEDFARTIGVNLIGSFATLRLFFEAAAGLESLPTGERGVVVNTASIAAYEGQVGQTAYAASKGGVVGLTLPAAREGASLGIRVCTIAPGIFETAMLKGLPEAAQESLGQSVPFPPRLGRPEEYARLVRFIVENEMLNGETIRLDGALRMGAR